MEFKIGDILYRLVRTSGTPKNINLEKQVTRIAKDTEQPYLDWAVVGYYGRSLKSMAHAIITEIYDQHNPDDHEDLLAFLEEMKAYGDEQIDRVLVALERSGL